MLLLAGATIAKSLTLLDTLNGINDSIFGIYIIGGEDSIDLNLRLFIMNALQE